MLEIEVRGVRNKAEQELAVVMSRTVRSLIRGQRRWREMETQCIIIGCEARIVMLPTQLVCKVAKTLGVKVLLWGTIQPSNGHP